MHQIFGQKVPGLNSGLDTFHPIGKLEPVLLNIFTLDGFAFGLGGFAFNGGLLKSAVFAPGKDLELNGAVFSCGMGLDFNGGDFSFG